MPPLLRISSTATFSVVVDGAVASTYSTRVTPENG